MTELPVYETAFIVMRSKDGSWTATSDLEASFEVEQPANHVAVRQGCSEILDVLHKNGVVSAVLAALEEKSLEDSQRVSASVRDALSRRKDQ
jgi:hypothetical protein